MLRDGRAHTAVSKTDHQQGPAAQHRAPPQCSAAAWMGGSLGRAGRCVCMGELLCCTPEMVTTLLATLRRSAVPDSL